MTPDVPEGIAVPNSTSTPTIERLAGLPRSERLDALQALVVSEFKATLLMAEEDELPMDGSFFDLGMTSLRLTEIKQWLDDLLGRAVSANSLFNRPTMNALLEHLTEEILPELFAAPAAEPVAAGAATGERALVDSLLHDLYRA
jgi:hypothetical protein